MKQDRIGRMIQFSSDTRAELLIFFGLCNIPGHRIPVTLLNRVPSCSYVLKAETIVVVSVE